MEFIIGNCFEITKKWNKEFDGIITDIPYELFSFNDFFDMCNNITKKDAFLISFCSMEALIDLVNYGKKFAFNFHTYQIWNKEPTRTWITWSKPLRTCEFIVYLKKGTFKFCFKDGTVKPAYNRSSFGGILKDIGKNKNKLSYGMYSEIIKEKIIPKKLKVHPTEKPVVFSRMFHKIVGNDKRVIDPFCGSGNLLKCFKNSVGMDINNWKDK